MDKAHEPDLVMLTPPPALVPPLLDAIPHPGLDVPGSVNDMLLPLTSGRDPQARPCHAP